MMLVLVGLVASSVRIGFLFLSTRDGKAYNPTRRKGHAP
jgi:hypothetical protein